MQSDIKLSDDLHEFQKLSHSETEDEIQACEPGYWLVTVAGGGQVWDLCRPGLGLPQMLMSRTSKSPAINNDVQ